MFRHLISSGILLSFVLVGAVACAADEDHSAEEQAAIAAAEKWLELADQGSYAESWQAAATYFQKAVCAGRIRQSHGSGPQSAGGSQIAQDQVAVVSDIAAWRADGKYVVIQYETELANKKSAVETITPMLEGDAWRVSGYFIR